MTRRSSSRWLSRVSSDLCCQKQWDGYRGWEQQRDFDRSIGTQFLEEALDRLAADPSLPRDVMSLPREVGYSVATHYGERCWFASELVDVLADPSVEAGAFDLIRRSPRPIVPHDRCPGLRATQS